MGFWMGLISHLNRWFGCPRDFSEVSSIGPCRINVWTSHVFSTCVVPSGYVKIAIENGHWNSGFSWIFPLIAWWFSIATLNYQRVITVTFKKDGRVQVYWNGDQLNLFIFFGGLLCIFNHIYMNSIYNYNIIIYISTFLVGGLEHEFYLSIYWE